MLGSMKGGVAKTVTTFNLAYSLKKCGKKVLAVDFDSQANLSTCFGIEDVTEVSVTIGDLMMDLIEEEGLPDPEAFIQSRKAGFSENSKEDQASCEYKVSSPCKTAQWLPI